MLIVAGYPDVEVAQREFEVLAEKVAAKELSSDGMILVAKDADGNARVAADTGNHVGRRGAGWGGGAGVLVGLSPRRCSGPSRWARPRAPSSATSPGTS